MVSLEGSYMVVPAEETPKGFMTLSDFDHMAPLVHVPTIYFYKNGFKFDSIVDILKDSLSKALVIFYPLAGRLRCIGRGRFEVDCNSMGAHFLVAKSQQSIHDFGDFTPTPKMRALIPPIEYNKTTYHEQPLVLVQITKLICGGISLGLLISHILVDGQGAMHFIDTWTKIARGEDNSIDPPILNRTIVQTDKSSPNLDHQEYSPYPLLIGNSDSTEEMEKESTFAMLKLSKDDITKLKEKSIAGGIRPYTAFETVAGHMWRCATEARNHNPEQQTKLYFTVNVRNRMEPPLPDFYFGNRIIRVAAESRSGELLSKPLAHAASKIREAIEKVNGDYVRSSLCFIREKENVSTYRIGNVLIPSNFFGNPNMNLTSWTSLPICGVDFGWGKEIYMGIVITSLDGNSYILPGRHEPGSLEILFGFQQAHMEDF